MFDMVKTAVIGFLTGKLFASPARAYGLMLACASFTAILFLGGWKLGLPLPAAAGVAALFGGALQPRLFKNLKYR
jgi:hypothetical protein